MTLEVNPHIHKLKSPMLRGFLFLSLFLLSACQNKKELILVNNQGFTQGTTYFISYRSKAGKNFHTEVKKVLGIVDSTLNTYVPFSEASKFNTNDSTFTYNPHFNFVLKAALKVAAESGGKFDPTLGIITQAWGFQAEKASSVTPKLVDSLMNCVGYNKISFDSLNRAVKADSCLLLDFNAIAQGYTVDLIAKALEEKGVEHYMIEVGGEVKARGLNSNNEFWRIGVDKPVEQRDASHLQAIISLDNQALATSGNYRKFKVDSLTGMKYSHSINALTGYPETNNLLSVSIIHESCMYADAYATACMLMGLEKAMDFVKRRPDIQAYFIYSDHKGDWKTWKTDGFQIKELE